MHITIAAPAKINLFLEITGKRNDGYHLLSMVMQTVGLYDDVTVTLDPDGDEISVSCNQGAIPCDSSNTAYRAALAFFEAAGMEKQGVGIKIKKRIPFGAGMAGGSADAAAVLVALNELTGAGLSPEELAEAGESVGADVPFCVMGGTMNCSGIGTIMSPLPDMPDCRIVVVKPELAISTPEAYRKADEKGYDLLRRNDEIVSGICNGSIHSIAEHLFNRFEDITGNEEIEHIKEKMMKYGALGAVMTGSGSAVFALFDDDKLADTCENHLHEMYDNVWNISPCKTGPTEVTGGLFSRF